MAKEKNDNKAKKVTQDLQNDGKESTRTGCDDTGASINALRIQIDHLKKKIADQEETIDSLIYERDEISDEVYELRLILADAWDIKRATNREKIHEVLRREREIIARKKKGGKPCSSEAVRRKNKVTKTYCDVTKVNNTNTGENEDGTRASDSGIDVQSLEKLIDERVAHTMDLKLAEHMKTKNDTLNPKSSDDIHARTIYTNKAEIINHGTTPMTISDERELNIIVHGLEEDDASTNSVVKEVFDTLEVKHLPTTLADRLGGKSSDKIRPIRITLECHERKNEIMSNR